MEAQHIRDRLTEIFRQTFDDDSIEITDGMGADEIPEWDSLAHINLILAVESSFGIRLTTREVRSVKNVGNFVELIARKAT